MVAAPRQGPGLIGLVRDEMRRGDRGLGAEIVLTRPRRTTYVRELESPWTLVLEVENRRTTRHRVKGVVFCGRIPPI